MSRARLLAHALLWPIGMAVHEGLHYIVGAAVGADAGVVWHDGRPAVALAWSDPTPTDVALTHLAPVLLGGPVLGRGCSLAGPALWWWICGSR